MAHIFSTGKELLVITRGPGTLRLLSWQSNAQNGAGNTIGGIPTTKSDLTRYVISFSHTYERFAFIWEGEGEAVYQIGEGLVRSPVGRAWNAASTINWGAGTVTTTDVTGQVGSAVNRDRNTTAFIIPSNL